MMIVAEITLKELVAKQASARNLTLERLAREMDMSWSQFHTVINEGISDGTRYSTIQKFASILGMTPSELIRLLKEG
jgi:DNA-binding Xre family transcriptional regulator